MTYFVEVKGSGVNWYALAAFEYAADAKMFLGILQDRNPGYEYRIHQHGRDSTQLFPCKKK